MFLNTISLIFFHNLFNSIVKGEKALTYTPLHNVHQVQKYISYYIFYIMLFVTSYVAHARHCTIYEVNIFRRCGCVCLCDDCHTILIILYHKEIFFFLCYFSIFFSSRVCFLISKKERK